MPHNPAQDYRRQQAIDLWVGGARIKDIAEGLGVDRGTVARWSHEPDFIEAVCVARGKIREAVRAKILDQATEAAAEVARLVHNDDARVRLAACRLILERIDETEAERLRYEEAVAKLQGADVQAIVAGMTPEERRESLRVLERLGVAS